MSRFRFFGKRHTKSLEKYVFSRLRVLCFFPDSCCRDIVFAKNSMSKNAFSRNKHKSLFARYVFFDFFSKKHNLEDKYVGFRGMGENDVNVTGAFSSEMAKPRKTTYFLKSFYVEKWSSRKTDVFGEGDFTSESAILGNTTYFR